MSKALAILALIPFFALPLSAIADPCSTPPALTDSREPNIFVNGLETDLGDALAEELENRSPVINGPELTAYLNRVGQRVAAHVPSGLSYRFYLVDVPDVQALSLAGGRVYVSRKLVAFLQSEDELAGIVAHEIGHSASHQAAIQMTRMLRVVVGIQEIHDRKDIFAQYHALRENYARNPAKIARLKQTDDKDQVAADRIGLYAAAAAGHDPEALTQLFDRLTGAKMGTGNFFSDLFNFTKPDARRLREQLKTLPQIPPACRTTVSASKSEPAEFKRWQADVAAYVIKIGPEHIPGLLSRTTLTPPLISDTWQLRFSPDGNYVLAQDVSDIDVLSHRPFSPLFHIDTSGAESAQFTPDSRQIVFSTSTSRMERWEIASRVRVDAREIITRTACQDRELSSNGKVFACRDGQSNLVLLDVVSGQELTQEPAFGRGLRFKAAFSPESRYFLAGTQQATPALAFLYDTQSNARVPLAARVRKLLTSGAGFLFRSPGRLLILNGEDFSKCGVYSFPGFEHVSNVELSRTSSYQAATSGNHLFIRPFREFVESSPSRGYLR